MVKNRNVQCSSCPVATIFPVLHTFLPSKSYLATKRFFICWGWGRHRRQKHNMIFFPDPENGMMRREWAPFPNRLYIHQCCLILPMRPFGGRLRSGVISLRIIWFTGCWLAISIQLNWHNNVHWENSVYRYGQTDPFLWSRLRDRGAGGLTRPW